MPIHLKVFKKKNCRAAVRAALAAPSGEGGETYLSMLSGLGDGVGGQPVEKLGENGSQATGNGSRDELNSHFETRLKPWILR